MQIQMFSYYLISYVSAHKEKCCSTQMNVLLYFLELSRGEQVCVDC